MDACGHTLLDAFTTHAEDARCGDGRLVHAEPAFGGRIGRFPVGSSRAAAPAEEAWAMRLAWRLLEAAHALHCRGVCHLDLSVENVCVGRSPPPPGEPARLTLIDFGMARLLSGGGDAAGGAGGGVGDLCVLGKLAYLAPEQRRWKVAAEAARRRSGRDAESGGAPRGDAVAPYEDPADVEAARAFARFDGAKADA